MLFLTYPILEWAALVRPTTRSYCRTSWRDFPCSLLQVSYSLLRALSYVCVFVFRIIAITFFLTPCSDSVPSALMLLIPQELVCCTLTTFLSVEPWCCPCSAEEIVEAHNVVPLLLLVLAIYCKMTWFGVLSSSFVTGIVFGFVLQCKYSLVRKSCGSELRLKCLYL